MIFTLIAGIYQYTEYANHKDEILTLVDEKLEIAAINGVNKIGYNFFETAAALEEVDQTIFYQAILDLSEGAKNNHVIYLYMMQKIDDEIVFILSSATDEELLDSTLVLDYMDPYEDAPDAVY